MLTERELAAVYGHCNRLRAFRAKGVTARANCQRGVVRNGALPVQIAAARIRDGERLRVIVNQAVEQIDRE